jgi:hypothetical protein
MTKTFSLLYFTAKTLRICDLITKTTRFCCCAAKFHNATHFISQRSEKIGIIVKVTPIDSIFAAQAICGLHWGRLHYCMLHAITAASRLQSNCCHGTFLFGSWYRLLSKSFSVKPPREQANRLVFPALGARVHHRHNAGFAQPNERNESGGENFWPKIRLTHQRPRHTFQPHRKPDQRQKKFLLNSLRERYAPRFVVCVKRWFRFGEW